MIQQQHVNSSGGKFATFQIPALHIISVAWTIYRGRRCYLSWAEDIL